MLQGFEEYANKSLSAAQVEKLLSTYIEYCHSMSTIRKVLGQTEEWELASRETIGKCVHILCDIIEEAYGKIDHQSNTCKDYSFEGATACECCEDLECRYNPNI